LNYFKQIYKAAISQSLDQLPPDTCLDEWAPGTYRYPAVTKLAREGKKEAVEWLLRQGANIDGALQGAAMAGDQAYVEELLFVKKGREYCCCPPGGRLGR